MYLPRDLTAGQTVAERYRLIALLGTGGMGSVWRAEQLGDGRECALKVLHKFSRETCSLLSERFMREAKAASSIDSPNAVRVIDYGMDAEIPFIAMELLEGETLKDRLANEGRLSPIETSRIVSQVASALERAHALGIVHRDLKPDNIFLARTAQGSVAKVLDFGIAKMQDADPCARDLTETGAVLGTPHYMSPEQVDGARYVDHRADLWSLAVIAFECISGQRPFHGEGLRALFAAICLHAAPIPSQRCGVPRGFDHWFAKATRKDPARRFRSAAALASALRDVCEQALALTPTQDEPEAPSEPGRAAFPRDAFWRLARAARRGSIHRVLSWTLGALLVAAAVGWISARGRSESPRVGLPSATAPRASASALPAVARSEPQRTVVAPTNLGLSPQPWVSQGGEGAGETPSRASKTPALPTRRLRREQTGPAPARGQQAANPRRWDLELMLRDRK